MIKSAVPGICLLVLASGAWAQKPKVPALPASIPAVTGEPKTMLTFNYIDIAVGTGKPAERGKCYYSHATGYLTNGTKFWGSRDPDAKGVPGKPLSFIQGQKRVIIGWDVGYEGMRVGGKRRLFIPEQLAYGEKGWQPPKIPPYSMLVFDVELMDVRDAPEPTRPPAPPAECPAY